MLLVVPDAGAAAAADVDQTYTYDLGNPGWAYCCDPHAEENWVRLDGRAAGLWGPPADERARPVYVLAPEADGSAYTGSAAIAENWIRIVGWELARPTPSRRSTDAPVPTRIPAPSATPGPTAPPLGPIAVPGTYTQRWSEATVVHLSAGSPLSARDGVLHNLAFNRDLVGRKLTVVVEAIGGAKPTTGSAAGKAHLFRSFVGPIKPQPGPYSYSYGSPNSCPSPTTPDQNICWVSAYEDARQWTISEGQYFVVFDSSRPLTGFGSLGYDSITYAIRID